MFARILPHLRHLRPLRHRHRLMLRRRLRRQPMTTSVMTAQASPHCLSECLQRAALTTMTAARCQMHALQSAPGSFQISTAPARSRFRPYLQQVSWLTFCRSARPLPHHLRHRHLLRRHRHRRRLRHSCSLRARVAPTQIYPSKWQAYVALQICSTTAAQHRRHAQPNARSRS